MPRRKRSDLNPPLKASTVSHRIFTPWQHKVKWQMEQAKAVGHWERYRELYRKLHANTTAARAAKRRPR